MQRENSDEEKIESNKRFRDFLQEWIGDGCLGCMGKGWNHWMGGRMICEKCNGTGLRADRKER